VPGIVAEVIILGIFGVVAVSAAGKAAMRQRWAKKVGAEGTLAITS